MKTLDAARGKWHDILKHMGIDETALDGKHHRCPITGEGEDRFRFSNRNGSGNFFCACQPKGKCGGIDLLKCRGDSFKEAAAEIDKIIGNVEPDKVREPVDPLPRLKALWKRCKPAGLAVRRYLKGRGLVCPAGLYEAREGYFDDGKLIGRYDCMVGAVQAKTGERLTLHVTYLANGTKAAVPSPRKVLPPIRPTGGGAIRLFPVEPTIGIAEGIETAIAAHMLFKLPVWSVMNRNGIETFDPPEGIKRVVIYGDRDASFAGQAGAYRAAERLARLGYGVDVQLPERGDWNDRLLEGAA